VSPARSAARGGRPESGPRPDPSGPSVVALIPAAGFGTRYHDTGEPKALVPLAGRPLIVHAIARLAASGRVDRAVVAVPEGTEAAFRRALAGSPIPVVLVAGGPTRRESVANAFAASKAGPEDLVCVHDAARPLVDPAEVAAVIDAAAATGAAISGFFVIDTVKRVHGGTILETVPREELFAATTPQVFRASVFGPAVAAGASDATDDAQIVERSGAEVRVVLGSRWNVKVTYPEDLAVAEALLSLSGAPAAGRGEG